MVAPAGAGPWPQITSVLPRLTSCTMIGTSPPGPLRCGSTTCSVKAVATPASKALPPFSSIAIPTAVAIQCVEVTTPKVPSISGRVVNGSGLMLLIESLFRGGRAAAAHLTTARLACQPDSNACLWSRDRGHRGHVDGMAGDTVDQSRRLLAAETEGLRAARVEGAACGRIDRVRNLAAHGNPLSAGHSQIRHRAQQHPGVGHARLLEQFARRRQFDDA